MTDTIFQDLAIGELFRLSPSDYVYKKVNLACGQRGNSNMKPISISGMTPVWRVEAVTDTSRADMPSPHIGGDPNPRYTEPGLTLTQRYDAILEAWHKTNSGDYRTVDWMLRLAMEAHERDLEAKYKFLADAAPKWDKVSPEWPLPYETVLAYWSKEKMYEVCYRDEFKMWRYTLTGENVRVNGVTHFQYVTVPPLSKGGS